MKKLLSILLSVALLLSMFNAIFAVAVENEEKNTVITALGNYYMFTFGENGDRYNYTVAGNSVTDKTGQATFKENNFYPLWINSADATRASYAYKSVEIEGKTYDVLEIKNFENAVLTPLTKDGTPFELIPGIKYSVNVKLFNPACNTWGQYFISAGSTNIKSTGNVNGTKFKKDADTNEIVATNSSVSAFNPHMSVCAGSVAGRSMSLYLKDGSYGTGSVNANCICYQYKEGASSCSHSKTSFNVYKETSAYLTLPEEVATYDEATNSFSVKNSFVDKTPEDTSDDTYDDANNYLTFRFDGGNVKTYADSNPVYSNVSAEEMGDAPSTWQIVSIEVISEDFIPNISYSANGEIIKTVEGELGTALETVIPTAPEGKYFVAWYNDEACTDVFTDTTLNFASKTVYAGFKDYVTVVNLDFEENKVPASAIQVTSAGNFWPLSGYSIKTNYSTTVESSKTPAWTANDLKNDLERNGFSTEYPQGVISFYSDRTWAMPGGIYFYNTDGTLFVPKAGDTYKVTYKYRAPLNNGNNMSINVVYGITNNFANKKSTEDKAFAKKTLKWNEITAPVSEWTIVTETITIPEASDDHVPALGFNVQAVKKVAIDTNNDETNDAYAFTMVQIDYMKVERVSVNTVTFLNADGSQHSVIPVSVGDKITYPKLTASLTTDNVWSASPTEYVEPPKTLETEENITIYAYENPVISYENQPVSSDAAAALHGGSIAFERESDAVVTDKEAYTGEKSLKLRNYGMIWVTTDSHYNTALNNGAYKYDAETDTFVKLNEVPEFVEATKETIANGTAYAIKRVSTETGMNVIRELGKVDSVTFDYKITFKYKATAKNTAPSKLSARIFAKENIWWGTSNITGVFTFPAGATDGWVTGEMYVSAKDEYGGNVPSKSQVLDLKFTGDTELFTNEIYIDDVTITEVKKALFVIPSGAVLQQGGSLVGNIVNVYAEMDEDIVAPVVIDVYGNVIEVWYDANGNEVTKFESGGKYVSYVATKYGDCNNDKEINTTDLAELKLYLAGLGEVEAGGDCDGNGEIDTTDLAVLKLYLAGLGTLGPEDTDLKVLGIGNSFTVDGTQYLWNVAASAGEEDFLVARAEIGGCSLDQHWENILTDAASYGFSVNDSGDWEGRGTVTLSSALLYDDWDVIVIQQVSQSAGDKTTYGRLQNIIDYIKSMCPDAEIMWQMTWAYQGNSTHSGFAKYDNDQMTMYNAIIDTANELIVTNPDISGIIPSGTAIQNLRTALGDNLTRDGFHLSYDYGRYCAAMTWYKAITGKNIDYVNWLPEDYQNVGDNLSAIKTAVNEAVAKPFEVTDISK